MQIKKRENRLQASERNCRVHFREELRFDPWELPLLNALIKNRFSLLKQTQSAFLQLDSMQIVTQIKRVFAFFFFPFSI
jgi:hypothetical protein